MKKLLSTLFLVLVSSFMAMAGRLSVNEAQAIAQNFLAQRCGNMALANSMSRQAKLTLAAKTPQLYVFNVTENAGFVIVADNDKAGTDAVLGYSDKGSFCKDSIPDALRWWLGEYESEIRFAKSTTGNRECGRKMKKADGEVLKLKEIVPLLKCEWGQTAPYNNLCPIVEGEHCPSGCLPTALAQIMYYNKYPEKGAGVSQGVDLSTHTYDWDQMTDTYDSKSSQTSIDAVATLMADIGTACVTKYTLYGSGTYVESGLRALKSNFGYKGAGLVYRNGSMTDNEWIQIIYNELENGRPVMYSGFSKDGGHSFVADGYKDNFLHINWGWYGNCNGYYKVGAFNPDSGDTGFNFSHSILTGIGVNAIPEDPQDPAYVRTSVSGEQNVGFKYAETSRSSSQTFTGSFHVVCSGKKTIQFGVEARTSGGDLYLLKGDKISVEKDSTITEYTLSLQDFPENNGIYIVRPAVWDAEKGKKLSINYAKDVDANTYIVRQKNGKLFFSMTENTRNIAVNNFSVNDVTDNPDKLGISATFSCLGTYFDDCLCFAVLNSDGDTVSVGSKMMVNLFEGGSANLYSELDAPTFSDDYTIEIFRDDKGKLTRFRDFSTTFSYQDKMGVDKERPFYGLKIERYIFFSADTSDFSSSVDVHLNGSIFTDKKRTVGIGVKVTDMHGNISYIKPSKYIEVDKGQKCFFEEFPVNLSDFPKAEGDYYVYPYVYDKDNDLWEAFTTMHHMNSRCFMATVADGKISFARKKGGLLDISYTDEPAALADLPFRINLKAECIDYDMCGYLFVGLYDKNNNVHLYKDKFIKANLEFTQSMNLTYKPVFSVADGIVPGEYKLGLFQTYGNKVYPVSNLLPLTVAAPVAELRLGDTYVYDSKEVDKELFRVSAKLTNRNCDQERDIAVFVFESDGKTLVDSLSQRVYFTRDFTVMTYFSWQLKNVAEGKTYVAKIFCRDADNTWIPVDTEDGAENGTTFTVAHTSGIESRIAANDGAADVYTVEGTFVGRFKPADIRRLPKGIYIIRRNGTAVKVCLGDR